MEAPIHTHDCAQCLFLGTFDGADQLIAQNAIIEEIRAERVRQDIQWGGPKHDDEHWPSAWIDFVEKQFDAAKLLVTFPSALAGGAAMSRYRTRLVNIAALCLAAIESLDRKTKGKA